MLLIQFRVKECVELVLYEELRVKSLVKVSPQVHTQTREQQKHQHDNQSAEFSIWRPLDSDSFPPLRVSNVVGCHARVLLQERPDVTSAGCINRQLCSHRVIHIS
jgi:hypothetical protein